MSGVILRCPACGTSQSHSGECDACYGGQVRYYCSNHSPGLWLDKAACKECGARFGDAPRRQPAVPPVAARPQPPRETRRSKSPAPLPPGAEPPRSRSSWPPDPVVTPAALSWAHLIVRRVARRLLERRRGTGYGTEEEPWRESIPELRLPRLPLKGCLVRFVLFALLLLALALAGTLILVGGALRF